MNGYIQLELGGVSRGVKFGNRALLDVMAKYNNFKDGFVFSFDFVADLLYFGLVNNCMNKKVNVDFTEDEVIEWADDMPMDKLKAVFEVFGNSFKAIGEDKPTKMPVKKGATSKK